MGKDPAFLFYPGDWLGGTMGMTFEEKGAYMELLMLQFNRGHMTKDMIGHTVGQLWVKIEDKFKVDDKGLYYNQRLEDEKIKRQKYTESRRNNILGINQHTNKEEKKSGHTTSRMKNENKDVNISKDKYDEYVLMTTNEYEKLITSLGLKVTQDCIRILNNYKGAHGKKYKSDYRAILSWVVDKIKTQNGKPTFTDKAKEYLSR